MARRAKRLSIRAQLLEEGGPALWDRFMAELREEHIGLPAGPTPDGRSVRERLQEAYLRVVAESEAGARRGPDAAAFRGTTAHRRA